ncbi:MAG TPA: radical SAM protein [Clostridia bacterium]
MNTVEIKNDKTRLAELWEKTEKTLAAKAAEKHIPLGGAFELTPRCNLRCKMCYIRMDKRQMDQIGHERTAKEWIALAKEAIEAGTLNLLITGGEPLIRDDFEEIYTAISYNPIDKQTVDNVRNGILGALRSITIAALSYKHGLLVHSSSIIWNGEGIVFAAPSGEGKSTHTNMWRQKYGTEILDGDVTALRIIDEVPYAYGLPWCGTSGEFLNKRVPLRAVVFLQRAEKNRIEKLNFQEAFIRLASRCFMLPYDERMTNQFLNVAQEIASKTDCYLLECLPDYEAVELVKKCLEKS